MVGDAGAGGTAGLVPAPGAGDAAAGKFLKADGVWTAIAGGGDMLAATYDPNTDGVIAAAQLDTTVIVEGDVDDVPVNGVTTAPISSNWAFDHDAATTGTHGVGAGTIAKTADIAATKLDDFTAPDDNTDLDVSTTKHGLAPKAVAPAAGLINVYGIANAETAITNKPLFDATSPTTQAFGDAAAVGTATVSARRDHKHAMMADPSGNLIAKALVTEQGDIIYASAASTPAALPHGTAGQVLQSGGHAANPSWLTVDNTAGGTDASIAPVTSNVLYDHGVATTGVHGVGAGTIAKTADITATKLDDFATPDANTDLNANTTNHGLLLQATSPAAGLYNYVGITNGETAYTNKALFDATDPSTQALGDAAAVGTAAVAARRDHKHAITAVGHSIADNAVVTVDDAAAADNDFAVFTANGIEGLPTATVLTNLLATKLTVNDSIILPDVGIADTKYSGIVEAGTAGAALAVGDICYFAVADSKWELAKADAAATSFGKIGICVLAANENAATTMLLWGKARFNDAFPNLTVGAPVFISAATAGDITSTAPSGTLNFVVRIVGYGNTADELFFCPDNTYIELAS